MFIGTVKDVAIARRHSLHSQRSVAGTMGNADTYLAQRTVYITQLAFFFLSIVWDYLLRDGATHSGPVKTMPHSFAHRPN